MIKIDRLSKTYGKGELICKALDEVSIELPENKFIAITGKSGSGKTTLLNMIGTVDKPDCGVILVDDLNVTKLTGRQIRNYRRYKIGMVFQFFNLITVLNAKDNILIANEGARKVDKVYFEELVDKLGIKELLHKYPEQLSGGQQQKVAIARALINKPKYILADEPTGNLDSENSKKVISLLCELAKNYCMTLIMVTHDEDIAAKADIRVYVSDGKVMSEI